jgi:UDPglucose 6-dehydrogenase
MVTERRTAELIKYPVNAFLVTKITFINEITELAEEVGANVRDVARGIGLDNCIGAKFLRAGPGFGGACFPKDTGRRSRPDRITRRR